MNSFIELPNEILFEILYNLSFKDLKVLSKVDTFFQRITSDEYFQSCFKKEVNYLPNRELKEHVEKIYPTIREKCDKYKDEGSCIATGPKFSFQIYYSSKLKIPDLKVSQFKHLKNFRHLKLIYFENLIEDEKCDDLVTINQNKCDIRIYIRSGNNIVIEKSNA